MLQSLKTCITGRDITDDSFHSCGAGESTDVSAEKDSIERDDQASLESQQTIENERNDQPSPELQETIEHQRKILELLQSEIKEEIGIGINRNSEETTNSLLNISSSEKQEKPDDTLSGNHDAYCFIMMNPYSYAALYSWLLFVIQIGIYAVIVSASFYKLQVSSDYARTAVFPLPVGVDILVHIAQGLAIPVILLVQTSLWEALLHLENGYDALRGQGVSYWWWLITQLIRLFEGIMACLVTFMILVESDNVLDLFKDFTAITFVSSFDNIFFGLARMHVIGNYLYNETVKVRSIRVKKMIQLQYRRRATWKAWGRRDLGPVLKMIIHPNVVSVVILALTYLGWFHYFCLPQYRGDFLCQQIFLQMTDRPFRGSSSRSGRFDLLTGKDKRDYYPTYRENKKSLKYDDRHATLLRFCDDIASWVITQEYPGKNGREKECVEYFLVSENVQDEDKFDIFRVSRSFFVKNGGNFKAGELVYLTCQDQFDPIDSKPCKEIEVDERLGAFDGLRKWSTKFSSLGNADDEVMVHDKPVYVNYSSTETEIVLFTGYRWVITYLPYLKDYQYSQNVDLATDKLPDYLTNDFHGNWSDYEVGFFSEGIIFGSVQDTSTPIGLKWYKASLKNDESNQIADMTQDVDNKFICTFCESDNPCFFESTCNSNGTCSCSDGLSGTLCQVLPTSNGHCNEYFNNREYKYDGGDCCIDTCKSTEKYKCGRDAETGKVYVGYDTCKREDETDTWIRSKTSSHMESLMISKVSLSANGRVLALIEWFSRSVRVYDNDGSDWIMRGPIVTHVNNPILDTVQVSCHRHFLYHREKMFPVTVSIISDSKIKIFEWKDVFWDETTPELITNTASKSAEQILLVNNGNSLGARFSDLSFKLYQREDISKQWMETKIMRNTQVSLFALSEDSTIIGLSHQSCIYVIDLSKKKMSTKCVNREVKQIHISPSGHYLAALEQYEYNEGLLHHFEYKDAYITKMHDITRGIAYVDATIKISDTGTNFLSYSGNDKKLRFFSFKNNIWHVSRQELSAEGFSMASNANTLVLLVSRTNSFGFLETWHNVTSICPKHQLPARLTFELDKPEAMRIISDEYSLEGTEWKENSSKTINFGPYYDSTGVYIAEDFCVNATVSQNKCYALTIQDWGLDGMRSPSSILSVAINGTVVQTLSETSSHTKYLWFHGNKTCTDDFQNVYRDYNAELHSECATEKCEWKEIGRLYHGLKSDSWSRGFAFSANAKAVAVGQFSFENETGQVSIWANFDGIWTPVGKNLTSGQLGSRFGYKVSISSDGVIVAIGAHRSNVMMTQNGLNITMSKVGEVYIYQLILSMGVYKFVPLGDVIVGNLTSSEPQLGYSVSLSSNGLYLAVSSREENCSVQVYEIDLMKNKWMKRGLCINENVVDVYVTISSIGSVVVIGARKSAVKGKNSGHVAIYRYNHLTNTWERKGNVIEGEGEDHFLGYFCALSADGDVLAAGGQAKFPLKVYKYEPTEDIWQQRGQDIIFSSIKIYSAMALSSSGDVLVYSYDNIIRVRVYDEAKQLWLDSLSSVPRPTYTGKTPQIIISADATTVAVKADDDLVIYQLRKTTSRSIGPCSADEAPFNFTITPDQFPQDIIWVVRRNDGVKIIGERLDKYEQLSMTPLVVRRCLKLKEMYTFHIVDDYGDGICCKWGSGSFTLNWNNKVMLTDTDFSGKAIVCLTENESATFEIHFKEYSRHVSWQLTNSTNEVVLKDDGYTLEMAQCMHPNECHTFRIFDKEGNGTAFDISYNNETLHRRNRDEKIFFYKRYIGCDHLPDRTLKFELEFLTNYNPEAFQWNLTSSDKGLIGPQGFRSIDQLKFYNFSYSISLQADECLSLNLNQTNGEGGTVYAVFWNGNLIESGKTNSSHRKVKIGNCG